MKNVSVLVEVCEKLKFNGHRTCTTCLQKYGGSRYFSVPKPLLFIIHNGMCFRLKKLKEKILKNDVWIVMKVCSRFC